MSNALSPIQYRLHPLRFDQAGIHSAVNLQMIKGAIIDQHMFRLTGNAFGNMAANTTGLGDVR